ncbi:MAG TPA: Ig-like domain-containing protein [Meiothermus sp.]|nr:Ig-like domain-containing protein [Meiothermus sp.]
MKHYWKGALVALLGALAACSSPRTTALVPGTVPEGLRGQGISTQALGGSSATQFTFNGKVSLSVDGLGTTSSTGNIRVDKPAGATVRAAYLAAASTGFTGITIPNGGILIDGAAVNWDLVINNSISSKNHWANVTSLVKPKIDSAAAGIVSFTITENSSSGIDGEILAVVFDDPGQTTDNTIVLLFGAQNIAGDTFNIGLATPINKSAPGFKLDFSLGISFSFQGFGTPQYSQVDVNGQRLTTAAGGEDDGQQANGALLTVGGIGDSNANPANPNATPNATDQARSDDELYSLVPFVNNGDTSITVFTRNPSNDDNIFFAALTLGATTAVVGEGIVLSPQSATNPVGTTHTITATLQDSNGNPIANRTVTFQVISGPNSGANGTAATDASGKASFTYTGSGGPGTDQIQASFQNNQGQTITSNTVTKTWEQQSTDTTPPVCRIERIDAGPPVVLTVFTQDSGSGLASIQVTESTNANTVVPAFSAGTTTPVIVTATKLDQTQRSRVMLKVTDLAGNVTVCDPVIVNLKLDNQWGRASAVVRGIPQVEGFVQVQGQGVSLLRLSLNGAAQQTLSFAGNNVNLNLTHAMRPGDNTAQLVAYGKPGSRVMVMFHDDPNFTASTNWGSVSLQSASDLNLDWGQ